MVSSKSHSTVTAQTAKMIRQRGIAFADISHTQLFIVSRLEQDCFAALSCRSLALRRQQGEPFPHHSRLPLIEIFTYLKKLCEKSFFSVFAFEQCSCRWHENEAGCATTVDIMDLVRFEFNEDEF
jgi:hypothetical protein